MVKLRIYTILVVLSFFFVIFMVGSQENADFLHHSVFYFPFFFLAFWGSLPVLADIVEKQRHYEMIPIISLFFAVLTTSLLILVSEVGATLLW